MKSLDEAPLAKLGVKIAYCQEWVGEPPNRHPETRNDAIDNVTLPFSPETWWRISSRDGDCYIGPCCGTTGAMQDIVCGMYRDSGHVASTELIRLAELARDHEGFESWHKELSQEEFEARLAVWETLDPWEQLGLIYQGTRAKLRDSDFRGTVPSQFRKVSDEKRAMWDLEHGLRIMAHEDMFSQVTNSSESSRAQQHATNLMLLARIIPACNIVHAYLSKVDDVFEGFAVCSKDKPDEVMHNGLGMCIYGKQKHVDELLEQWKKSDEKVIGKLIVRRVRVTSKDGLSFV